MNEGKASDKLTTCCTEIDRYAYFKVQILLFLLVAMYTPHSVLIQRDPSSDFPSLSRSNMINNAIN